MAEGIRTTCPYCGVGCGVIAQQTGEGWTLSGDPDHPANHGRLCSKGSALAETLRPDTRLHHPVVDGQAVDWDTAITTVAGRLAAVRQEHGAGAIAFYLSGQLLTEDYYVANKLAKGFLGTPHVDTNSRLCMASTVAGHRRAFGGDVVPGCYEDLDLADQVVLVGSNLAWCHPVLFQRLRRAQSDHGTRVVVIDPRRTDTCDSAAQHLQIRAGSDLMLFNGLLVWLADQGALDRGYLDRHVEGFETALTAARADAPTVAAVATHCGVPPEEVIAFYTAFANTPRTVTVFSQGVNQSASGTDTVNAILNAHLATGRIGQPGSGPFSVTGQPNAMGGREVGGLANQLAAHMGFSPIHRDRVARFWQAPALVTGEGLKAVDLFRAIDAGTIRAVWIMATNPTVSLPEAALVRRALENCPLVIVSDCVGDTDTLRHAHIRLPARGWGEKDGTVTNSDRTISRQRAFLPPTGSARTDWEILRDVGQALGYGPAFSWPTAAAVFREHAALSAFENHPAADGGPRAFDIGAYSTVSDAAYQALKPFPWPQRAGQGTGTRRLFSEGAFVTPSGRAQMIGVRTTARITDPARPLILNTARYRDQWHTMTRTGLVPRLSGHRPEPLLEIHPEDAARYGLTDRGIAEINGEGGGTYRARVAVSDTQRRGELCLPMHWSDHFGEQTVSGAVLPGRVDPISGQPDSKRGWVTVTAVPVTWHGLLLTATPDIRPSPTAYAVRHTLTAEGGQGWALAGFDPIDPDHFAVGLAADETLAVSDPAKGVERRAWLRQGQLLACLFLAPHPLRWPGALTTLLGRTVENRTTVLAGRTADAAPDSGPLVCSCFAVGLNTLHHAITRQSLRSVEEIGAALAAGTGCGSCLPELKRALAIA